MNFVFCSCLNFGVGRVAAMLFAAKQGRLGVALKNNFACTAVYLFVDEHLIFDFQDYVGS